jgi:Dihydrodipicolinate reductase
VIRIVVVGAAGRMGREVLKSVWNSEDMQLVGAADVRSEGQDVGTLIGMGEAGIRLQENLERVFQDTGPDVMVDFTIPESVAANIKLALQYGVRLVVGTTGLGSVELAEIVETASRKKVRRSDCAQFCHRRLVND